MKWKKILATGASVLALSAASVSAQAMGGTKTPAGTSITSTVDLTYSSGGKTIEVEAAASTTFVVDRKVDAMLTAGNAGPVPAIPGETAIPLSFTIENTGNDVSNYDIDLLSTGSDGSLVLGPAGSTEEGEFWVVISDNPQPGLGNEIPYVPAPGINGTRDVPADGLLHFHVYANVPLAAVSRQQFGLSVIATALKPGGLEAYEAEGDGELSTVDTVIVDGEENLVLFSGGMIDIHAPELSATKSVKILSDGIAPFDCENGAEPAALDIPALPGSCVSYEITLVNAPTASDEATDMVMTDELPEHLEFVTSINGGFDSLTWSGPSRTLRAELGTLPVGEAASFIIRARIAD